MSKTIVLTAVQITAIVVDITSQKVIVNYNLVDANGVQWGPSGGQTYWVTLPTNPSPADSQLPTIYMTSLSNLQNAALADITSKYLS
jgi:hypothetical protein